MALMKEGLWKIVIGDEGVDESVTAKYVARRDQALATVVLSIDPSLSYLLGDLGFLSLSLVRFHS